MTSQVFKSEMDISPHKEFEKGINFNFNVNIGEKGKEVIKSLPEYVQNNPVTYAVELNIEDAEKGSKFVEVLEGVKDMLVGMIPGIDDVMSKGLAVKFRHLGKSVFIDFSFEGEFAEMVKSQVSLFKLDLSQFTESGEFHLASGIKLNNPLETSYEDFVKMATQFSLKGKGEMPTSMILESVDKFMTQLLGGGSGFSKINIFLKALKLLSCMKKLTYKCKYDSDEMCTYVKDLAGRIAHNTMGGADMNDLNSELGTQMIGSFVAQYQEVGKTQLEGIKQMAGAFLDPYKEQLLELNLDNITMHVLSPHFSAAVGINICLVGLTEFVRSNILN